MRSLAAAFLFLVSCSAVTLVHIPEDSELSTDIVPAMRKWTDAGMQNYHYRFKYADSTGCQFPEVEVSVENRIVASMVFAESGPGCNARKNIRKNQDASEEMATWNVTVGNLFVRVVGIQESSEIFGMSNLLTTKFHPKYGFPVVIALDIPHENAGLADNRFEYRTTRFEIW